MDGLYRSGMRRQGDIPTRQHPWRFGRSGFVLSVKVLPGVAVWSGGDPDIASWATVPVSSMDEGMRTEV